MPTAGGSTGSQMDLGKPVMEPDLEAQGSATEAPEISTKNPKGGEI
jgi:hypothetical protein